MFYLEKINYKYSDNRKPAGYQYTMEYAEISCGDENTVSEYQYITGVELSVPLQQQYHIHHSYDYPQKAHKDIVKQSLAYKECCGECYHNDPQVNNKCHGRSEHKHYRRTNAFLIDRFNNEVDNKGHDYP